MLPRPFCPAWCFHQAARVRPLGENTKRGGKTPNGAEKHEHIRSTTTQDFLYICQKNMSDDKKGCLGTTAAIVAIIGSIVGIVAGLKEIGWIGDTNHQPKQEARKPVQPSNDNTISDLEERLRQMEDKDVQQREEGLRQRIADLEVKQRERAEAEPDYVADYDLSGDWYPPANPNTVYRITQSGREVTLQEISYLYGVQTVTAAGSGAISGNALRVNYYTMFNTTGVANFNISNGGQNLNGQLYDNTSGMTMPLLLQRR